MRVFTTSFAWGARAATLAGAVVFSAATGAALLSPALGNELAVPIIEHGADGHMATCYSSTVAGLDPNGDGFLAVRAGPGTDYRQVDSLHNGDVVYVFERNGPWAGVLYGPASPGRCTATSTSPLTEPDKGWIHSNWLRDLAG